MRKAAVLTVLLGVFLSSLQSRGDVATPRPTLPSPATSEQITGKPAISAPGDEQPQRDPFKPYDIGPPGTKGWDYNQLSAAERANANRPRDAAKEQQSLDAFAAAAMERARNAAAASAAHQLGLVDDFAGIGVVP